MLRRDFLQGGLAGLVLASPLGSTATALASVAGKPVRLDEGAVQIARAVLEERYRDFDPSSSTVSGLFHLYLARILPTSTADVEQVLRERTELHSKWLEHDRPHVDFEVYEKGTRRDAESHFGQLAMLLNLMADDGIISRNPTVGKVKRRKVRLRDLDYGSSRGLELSDNVGGDGELKEFGKSSLEMAAWNLINVRTLPRSYKVGTWFDGKIPLGKFVDDVYEQLSLLSRPYDSLPQSNSMSGNLRKSGQEWISHGSVNFAAYERANKDRRSEEKVAGVYEILRQKLEGCLVEGSTDIRELGHYLEAMGRLVEYFPSIDYRKDRSILVQAVNIVAREIFTQPEQGLDASSHALMGVEKVYNLVFSDS